LAEDVLTRIRNLAFGDGFQKQLQFQKVSGYFQAPVPGYYSLPGQHGRAPQEMDCEMG
jgi:hypothetical protein